MLFDFHRGVEEIRVRNMIHLEKLEEEEELDETKKIPRSKYKESFDVLRELYDKEIDKGMNRQLEKIKKKYGVPVYFYFVKDFNQKEKNTEIALYRNIVVYDLYVYARHNYFKKIIEFDELIKNQKLEDNTSSKKSFFKFIKNKIVDYEALKNDYINEYISKYLLFFKENFGMLKLDKKLIDELENVLWISLRFDLFKPIIILDDITEKIYTFILMLKNIKGENSSNIFIDSVKEDFTVYLNKQMAILSNIEKEELLKKEVEEDINEDLMKDINKMKKTLLGEDNSLDEKINPDNAEKIKILNS